MGKILVRRDSLQRGTKATRPFAVSRFLPWSAVFQWIAITLPCSCSYLLASSPPKQTNVDSTAGKLHTQIRPANGLAMTYFPLPKEQRGTGRTSTFRERGGSHADERQEEKGIGETPGSLLSVGTRAFSSVRSKVSSGRPPDNHISKHLEESRGTDLSAARKIKPHLHHSFASRRESTSTRGSDCTLQVNKRTENKHRLLLSEIAVKASAHKHHQPSSKDSNRGDNVTTPRGKQPREDRRQPPVFTETPVTSLQPNTMGKKDNPRTPSFVHSGTKIIDELMATAMATSSAFLAPQSMGRNLDYSAVAQMQPALTPAQSVLSMSLPQPPPQGSQLEDIEIIFIAVGCVVSILLIVLVWLMLSGQKKWRV